MTEQQKTITVTVRNEWLEALEDILTVENTRKEEEKLRKKCMELLHALLEKYDH